MNTSGDKKLVTIYSDVVSCPLRCHGIRNAPESGIIPRSFYFESPCDRIQLLIVGKNPAHSQEWESAQYRSKSPSQRVRVSLRIVNDLFLGDRSVGSSFHANLIRRVAAILGVKPIASHVFSRAAHTTLEHNHRWMLNEPIRGKRPLTFRVAVPARTAKHARAVVQAIWTPGAPTTPDAKLLQAYGFIKKDTEWDCTSVFGKDNAYEIERLPT